MAAPSQESTPGKHGPDYVAIFVNSYKASSSGPRRQAGGRLQHTLPFVT